MKKACILLLVTALMAFATCGSSRTNEQNGYEPAAYEPTNVPISAATSTEAHEETAPTEPETEPTPPPPHPNAGFISDVEYMLYVLENNFALFDVAYWGRGVDIYAIVDGVINTLTESDAITVYEFDGILMDAFTPLLNIGHFAFLERRFSATPIADENQDEDYTNDELREFAEALLSDESLAQFYVRRQSLHFSQDIPDLLATAIASSNIDEIVYVLKLIDELEPYGGANVRTQIIETDSIAYLSLLCLLYIPESEIMQMRNFYKEITDFEHLIIDLRGNVGGSMIWFYDLILNPLRPGRETITVDSYFLTPFGMHTQRMIRLPLQTDNLFIMSMEFNIIDTDLRPFNEILEESYLPLLHPSTLNRNHYGFRVQLRIDYTPFYLTAMEDIDVIFNGHVWLLIDEWMFSAAHVSAWVAKESGFATLVGTNTGGAFGGSPRYRVRLPHSGFSFEMDFFNILDSRGYAIEAGIVPHHFNRPGMDAIATTLALIAERDIQYD